jgi:hypothetical protein
VTRERLVALGLASVLLGTLAIGAVYYSPSLRQGLYADDFVAVAMMEGKLAAPRHPLDLFNFADGSEVDVRRLKRLGSLPWWTPADFRVAFMRPLSSALWHFDRFVFGTFLPAYHAHSIFAWMLLAIFSALCFVRFLPAGIAALAIPLFALDHCHHFPVVWLSNRGGLYAIALGLLGLYLHVQAREQSRPTWLVGSAASFALGLLFGEWAFPMLGYVLAYELLSAPGSRATRVRALLPVSVLAMVFIVARAALGYGARGSGAYVDPGAEPGRFVIAALGRIPVFIADMLFNLPSTQWDHGSPLRERVLALELFSPPWWGRMPDWRFFHAIAGALACLLLAWLLRWCLRGANEREARMLRFLVLGALLSLVPVVGSFPSSRLTMAASFGIAALLAFSLREIGRRLWAQRTRTDFALGYLAVILIGYVHFAGPLMLPLGPLVDQHAATRHWVLRAELDPARVAKQRVYLISAAEFTTTFYFAYIWGTHGLPLPRSFAPVSVTPFAVDLSRTGAREFRLHALGGGFLTSGQEQMFRARDPGVQVGQRFDTAGMRVTVLRAERGQAQLLGVELDRSLDDPDVVLLHSTPEGIVRLQPPAIGASSRIRRAAGPSWAGLEAARVKARLGPPPIELAFDPVPEALAFDPDP